MGFLSPKSPPPAPLPPAPKAPRPPAPKAPPKTADRKKQRRIYSVYDRDRYRAAAAGKGQTLLTSPLGLSSDTAPVRKKTLLGM